MIAFLNGVLAAKSADSCVVEAQGVGFALGMSAHSLAQLPEVGGSVRVFTHLQMRDDGLFLYGFTTTEEQRMFEQLIGVSTVGPKMALAALSTYAPGALAAAIMASDVDAVSRIPGIGKKKASRIILELQGTLAQADEAGSGGASDSAVVRAVVEDLLAMGFTSAEADLALRDAPTDATEQEVLQYALRRMGQ